MSRQLKVGIFVIAGLALTMVAVFLIGDTRGLWEAKGSYQTAFNDVAGLKPGAPVRMGGLDIGAVTGVRTSNDPSDARVFVAMAIDKREAVRIRTDTVARVINKGLLGDKMIELSVGSPRAPALVPAQLIASSEPTDVLASANKVAAATQEAIERLEPLAQALGDPKFAEDVKGSAADVHALLDALVRGDGTVHRLFFDHGEADQIDALLANLTRTSTRLDAALSDLQDVTGQIRSGNGIAHALVYDGQIAKDAAGAIAEAHTDLAAIRERDGLAHALLFGDDDKQHMVANLGAMTSDLRAIVAGVRQGHGTIGGLLVDPTVYEDIRSLVSNVQRNEVLRALVRYSIKADEETHGGR